MSLLYVCKIYVRNASPDLSPVSHRSKIEVLGYVCKDINLDLKINVEQDISLASDPDLCLIRKRDSSPGIAMLSDRSRL